MNTPPQFLQDVLAQAHPSWHPALYQGLAAVKAADPEYLSNLSDSHFLPTAGRLFAAFAIPIDAVRYVLVGEGPYPREDSATGFCFMDGAVTDLWSQETGGGLSKKVNRATSLRNFIKMLLVTGGYLTLENTSISAIAEVASKARATDSVFIQSLPELQDNLLAQGFLLLNASLVFRSDVAPAKDAKSWLPFLQSIFLALNEQQNQTTVKPTVLVLWGKIAEQLQQMSVVSLFQQQIAEHPYNLSFIGNKNMQDFFAPMNLLHKRLV